MTFVLNLIYFWVLAFSFLHEQKHNLYFKSASVCLSADFLIKYSREKWASAMQIFSRTVLFKTHEVCRGYCGAQLVSVCF